MGDVRVLFIHGAGGTSSKWRNVAPYFPDHMIEIVNLPGREEGSVAERTIHENALKISQLITEDTVVVGHSMGGLVGLELAKLNNNVKGLVLASSFYELPVHPKILTSFDNGEFPDSLFYASYTKDVDKDLIAQEKLEKEIVPHDTIQKDFHACNNYEDGAKTLKELLIPVLAIYGNADKLLPPKVEDSLKEIKEDIQIIEMDEASHYLILERAEQFSNEVKKFIEQLS